MERFGKPWQTQLGSDGHAPGIVMLVMGTGGLDVALTSAGEPYYIKMPKIISIYHTRNLSYWASAKDIVLEMLRKYDVTGGRGYILEYYGEGLKCLIAWDRHIITSMGAELGPTSSVFPSDEITREFLRREDDWIQLEADEGLSYDHYDEINLSELEPLIALTRSPGKVVPVREVSGLKVAQVVIGSSANPGLRDFWIISQIVKGNLMSPHISLDVTPLLVRY
jgi:aconitate hydratase